MNISDKLELKQINKLIRENKKLKEKYPEHRIGLQIGLTTLEHMKEMLTKRINKDQFRGEAD